MLRSALGVAIVLALALEVALPTAKAETIECRATPETREYWSWREIDGRRCWFKGHRSISKKLLSWWNLARRTNTYCAAQVLCLDLSKVIVAGSHRDQIS